QQDPQGPVSGVYCVVRGGSWDYSPWDVSVSFRNRFDPAYSTSTIGIRCAGDGGSLENGAAITSVTASPINTTPSLGSAKEPAEIARVRVNPKDGLRYAWVPPGKFMMGCS